MYDGLVAQRLAENNQMYNAELKRRLDVIMSRERFLDKAPDKYTPVCKGLEFEPFGVYSVFRSLYAKYDEELANISPGLNIDGESVECDRKSYLLLRTLMDVGVTKSLARAVSCRELFTEIINRRSEAGLTVNETVKALVRGDDYYKNEIIRAGLDSMFTEKEKVSVELHSMLGDAYRDGLLEALGNPQDVDELDSAIRSAYKKACANQEFRVKKSLGRAANVARYLEEGFTL